MQIGQLTEIEVLPVQRVGGRGEGIHIYPVQRHTAAAAARRHTSATDGAQGYSTASQPGLMIPDLVAAIFSTVSPR